MGGYVAEKHDVRLVRSDHTRPTYFWVNANPARRGGGGGGARLAALNTAVWGELKNGRSVSPESLEKFGFRRGYRTYEQKMAAAGETFDKMKAAREVYFTKHPRTNFKFGRGGRGGQVRPTHSHTQS